MLRVEAPKKLDGDELGLIWQERFLVDGKYTQLVPCDFLAQSTLASEKHVT